MELGTSVQLDTGSSTKEDLTLEALNESTTSPPARQIAAPLPTEIVVHIFLSCIEDDNDRWIRIGPLAMPLVLSGVCAQWRDIAFSMPALWTHIEIVRRGEKLELFKRWLARTDTQPISVRMSFTARNHPRLAWKFIDALADHRAQWEDIDLYVPERTMEDTIQLEGSFPMLRRLSIELPHPEYSVREVWPRAQVAVADFQDARVLSEVKLVGWYHTADVILPWAQLTTLTLESCRIGVLRGVATMAIFHLCPNLVKCTLVDIAWDPHTVEPPPPPTFCSAPRLQELYLYSGTVNLGIYFLFPHLKRLRLPCYDEDLEACWLALIRASHLDYLCLSIEGYVNARELIHLLRHITSGIRELKIEYTTGMNFSIDPGLYVLRDEPDLLPHLTTFELHPIDGGRGFPYALLVEVLNVRLKNAMLQDFTITVDEGVVVDEIFKAQFLALAEKGLKITVVFNK
ncbi:hypothetical protein B0H19DRAFT_1065840 [Mycena capillaripes]|nr:hypothetical protein B0H19DRAFT_1065840 [Mycena capillaripes]